MRAAKGTDTIVYSPIFTKSDGETGTLATGTVWLTVTRDSGSVIGSIQGTAVADRTGVYQATLNAGTYTASYDQLTGVWAGTADGLAQSYTDTIDIVGGHFCTLAEIRQETGMENAALPRSWILTQLRDEFADLAESYCQVAFVPSYGKDAQPGNNTDRLMLSRHRPTSVLTASVDGTSIGTASVELTPIGQAVYTGGSWSEPGDTLEQNCVVSYVHGWDAPPPELRRAAVTYVKAKALARTVNTPRDAISETFNGETVRYSTPDARNGRPTGILDVDAVLNTLTERLPAVG